LKLLAIIYNIYFKGKSHTHIFSDGLYSFLYGLIGFLSFLSLIIVAKYFNYIVGTDDLITIDVLEIFLALMGFGLVYIFKRLEKKSNRGS
jgi:hypothetical protein